MLIWFQPSTDVVTIFTCSWEIADDIHHALPINALIGLYDEDPKFWLPKIFVL